MNEPRRPDAERIARRRLQTEAMLGFSRVSQQVLRATVARLEQAGIRRITPAGANALIVLFNARRPILARDLAAELAITEVTVSRLLERMEEDGWVERRPDPSDGRAKLVAPTRYARDQLPRLVAACNGVLDDIFGGLADHEQDVLADLLGRIQGRLAALQDG